MINRLTTASDIDNSISSGGNDCSYDLTTEP
jgi:hypothetical protein